MTDGARNETLEGLKYSSTLHSPNSLQSKSLNGSGEQEGVKKESYLRAKMK